MSHCLAINSNATLDMRQVCIRPLSAEDMPEYRRLRAEIRQSYDARFFSDSYTREDNLTEAQWLDWCTEKAEHCIIGTFVRDELVGIVMATQFGCPADRTVEWEASWLDPRYRGAGITPMAYKQVKKWTEHHGYTTVKVFIRADNYHWLDVRRKQGFVQTGTKSVSWADGSHADMHIFSFDLVQRRQQTLRYLEKTYSSLSQNTQNSFDPARFASHHLKMVGKAFPPPQTVCTRIRNGRHKHAG